MEVFEDIYDIFLVYLPLKLDEPYYYKAKKLDGYKIGDVILVPLRNQEVYGVIYKKQDNVNFNKEKIREIIKKSDDIEAIDSKLMLFLEKLSTYNLANFGNVLKMALTVTGLDFQYLVKKLHLSAAWQEKKIKLTTKRQGVINFFLSQQGSIDKNEIIKATKVNLSVINSLIEEGVLLEEEKIEYSSFQKNLAYKGIKLREEQEEVVRNINLLLQESGFKVVVLEGIPGSGKTEVYFEAMNEVLKAGKQVLIMLPEIALSTQIVNRFKERFGVEPYVWHSGISKKQKKDTWVNASNGNLKVVIGARSALFLPFLNLGMIIVDEEHDQSYKQEEGVIYNARDMAVLRAYVYKVPIILSSATPSLETMNNVSKDKYKHFKLLNRFNMMPLPKIQIVDMRKESLAKNSFLSKPLISMVEKTLKNGEQALLFINKRGYASCILCKSCGEKVTCKNCSVNLVSHNLHKTLNCHYCGYYEDFNNACLHCGEENSLIMLGTGVEKIFEEVEHLFPNRKVMIISSDTISSHKKAKEMVDKINNMECDILIGTQIISKGYHFPKLTAVCIVDGDLSYALDLKSAEKTWQLFYQVAGRSGREVLKGNILLQTFNPNNYLFNTLLSNDYEGFLKEEVEKRLSLGFPPFGKLASIVVSAKNKSVLTKYCDMLERKKPQLKGVEILGYSEAPLFYLRNYYRNRFLVKTTLEVNIQEAIKIWLNGVEVDNGIKLQIDIDPLSFY